MSEKMTEHCLLREMQGRMSIGARNVVLALITERDQLREDLRIERLRAQEELCAESERLAYSRCETEDVAAYAAAKLAAAEERMAAMEGALRAAISLECLATADLGDGATGPACVECGNPFGHSPDCSVKVVVKRCVAALDGTTPSQGGEGNE